MRDWPSLWITFPPGSDSQLTDLVAASFDASEVAAIEERSPARWLVSFREAAGRDAAAAGIRAAWSTAGVTVAAEELSDEDWARRSQAALGAVRVGRFIVTPPWCIPGPDEGRAGQDGHRDDSAITLVIEPSMGFGSGHHATTRLCLEALQAITLAGTRVIDIGTGSGILAIAAAKLGAASVIAIDNDADALAAARAAAAANGPLPELVCVESDFRSHPPGQADVVLANLTASMLATEVAAVAGCIAPGGHVVLSGITTAEAPMIFDAYLPLTDLRWRGDRDGWIGLLLRKPA